MGLPVIKQTMLFSILKDIEIASMVQQLLQFYKMFGFFLLVEIHWDGLHLQPAQQACLRGVSQTGSNSPFFTEWSFRANSVMKFPCLFFFFCLRHCKTPTTRDRGHLWSKNGFLMLACEDKKECVFFPKIVKIPRF